MWSVRTRITKNPENLPLHRFISYLNDNPQKHMVIPHSFEIPPNKHGENYLFVVDTMDFDGVWVRRLVRGDKDNPVDKGLIRQIRKLRRERVCLSYEIERKVARILKVNYDDLEGLTLHNEVFGNVQ